MTGLVTDTGDHQLISDLARYSEGVLTEAQIRRKYRNVPNDVWDAPPEPLVDAVEAEERVKTVREAEVARRRRQIEVLIAESTLFQSGTNGFVGTGAGNISTTQLGTQKVGNQTIPMIHENPRILVRNTHPMNRRNRSSQH